ncbi:NAD(P)H-dependent oxidoreductase [Desulfosporosinus nitroreducens]|uniref:NAD(P)H-dependent oxidoreductase n=1 Tax=Desulfosporosinus nitroreducens TaxID=2018668 RepID=UPI00207D43F8|nr:NAD(P)H-dependent oxidoreductase [Desulfosporosinus nitroreducens]MCO1604262.1 NAD(P)H-dependent oxidoreductase [Desulfosporosinus nitroreducens]
MKALLISDKEFQTKTYQNLKSLLEIFLNTQGLEIKILEVGTDDLAFCMGCFGCWIKKPGECVINDKMAQINRNVMTSDVVIYLNPIIFGQFSANIKNVIDRYLPNMLPFFEIRPDGSTMHPPRYDTYPKSVIIGYGSIISEDDKQLFIDITKKHRRNIEVIIYDETPETIIEALTKMELGRVDNLL